MNSDSHDRDRDRHRNNGNYKKFDVLRYFSRAELEGLQMHSCFLRDLVDRNVNKLPLRPIYSFGVSVRF